ncbi:putative dynein heavy chain, partial [Trypanosoma cruzi]
EELSPADWLGKRDGTGGVSCKALHNKGKWRWLPARVTEWNAKTNILTVEIADIKEDGDNLKSPQRENGAVVALPRLYVCFDAENPRNFVDRFAEACRLRTLVESVLRQQLYVESIPPDEYQVVDPLVLERVHNLSLNTPKLRENEAALAVNRLLEEVRTDYSRVMNFELMRQTTKNGALTQLFSGSGLPPERPVVKPRECGVYGLRRNCFREVVNTFYRDSFFACNAITISVLQRVKEGNDALLSRTVFRVDQALEDVCPMTMDAFEELQVGFVRQNAQFIREKWVPDITKYIKNAFSHCMGASDVSLHLPESVYGGSKTQRLMCTITLQMQD